MFGQHRPGGAASPVTHVPDGATPDIAAGLLGNIRRTTLGARRDINHWHEDVEFDLVLSGTASYALDDRVFVVTPGTIIWLAPGQQHKLLRSPNLQMWVVLFRAGLLEPGWLEDLAEQPSRVVSSHELIDLDGLLTHVAQDSDEPAAYNAGLAYVVMRALRASRDRPSASLRPLHPAVTRALLIMRREGGAGSLSDLAGEAGIAAHYLSRLLVEQTGRGFVDWRNRIRLDRFMAAYTPGANLLAAALDAGFGSYTRFHHIFNDILGCSPSEWASRIEAGKPAPGVGPTAVAAGFRPPGMRLLSARQRWTALIPLIAPAIRPLLGEVFLERLVSVAPREDAAVPGTLFGHETALSEADVADFLDSLRAQHAELAEDYGRMLAAHDFEHLHGRILGAFDASAASLVDVTASTVAMVWSAMRNRDVNPDEAAAIMRQVAGVFAAHPPRLERSALRAARVALVCQFVVAFQAAQSARGCGDDRRFEAIRAVGRDWSLAVLGRDVAELELTAEGFAAPAPARPARWREAG